MGSTVAIQQWVEIWVWEFLFVFGRFVLRSTIWIHPARVGTVWILLLFWKRNLDCKEGWQLEPGSEINDTVVVTVAVGRASSR